MSVQLVLADADATAIALVLETYAGRLTDLAIAQSAHPSTARGRDATIRKTLQAAGLLRDTAAEMQRQVGAQPAEPDDEGVTTAQDLLDAAAAGGRVVPLRVAPNDWGVYSKATPPTPPTIPETEPEGLT